MIVACANPPAPPEPARPPPVPQYCEVAPPPAPHMVTVSEPQAPLETGLKKCSTMLFWGLKAKALRPGVHGGGEGGGGEGSRRSILSPSSLIALSRMSSRCVGQVDSMILLDDEIVQLPSSIVAGLLEGGVQVGVSQNVTFIA